MQSMFLSNSLSLLPLDLWWEEEGLLLLGLTKGAAPIVADMPTAPTSALPAYVLPLCQPVWPVLHILLKLNAEHPLNDIHNIRSIREIIPSII